MELLRRNTCMPNSGVGVLAKLCEQAVRIRTPSAIGLQAKCTEVKVERFS
jgi:hypothetical protein